MNENFSSVNASRVSLKLNKKKTIFIIETKLEKFPLTLNLYKHNYIQIFFSNIIINVGSNIINCNLEINNN